jgi:radical SAM protein with 4Fe4S-binding SPASM domain
LQSRVVNPHPCDHPLDRVAREPRTCIWEITAACNLRCVHCDNHAARPSPRELHLPRLLETAEQLAALGCRLVDITGGEPLLMPDWDRLSQHLTSRGIDVAIVTNGTLLDAEAIERAVAARVAAIAISLDGLRATHDATRRFARGTGSAFDAAVAGLELARAHFPVTVITQVNCTNLGELWELGNLLGELSVSRWQLQLAIPTPRVASLRIPYVIAPRDLEQLTEFIVAAARDPKIPMIHTSDTIGYATPAESILRRKATGPGLWLGCAAGIRAVAIKYDGTVRGCSLMPSDFSAGDLHDESLSAIWNDRTRFAYSTEFERTSLSGGCKSCRFGSICRAGCTTMAYFATGTIGDNPYCLRRVREQRQ